LTINPKVSIIVPIYNEEIGILDFSSELKNCLDLLKVSYEVLYINDGSTDSTQEKINSLEWLQLRKFEFQSNAGHMHALQAGYEKSQGKLIITIDSDLQHPPKYIEKLIEMQENTGADVVYGIRDSRKEDSLFKRWSAGFYYFLMRRLSGINIRTNAADFRLITKFVKDVLVNLEEENKIYRLLIPSFNFKEAVVFFKADPRKYGKSKYGMKKMGMLAISSVLSFSIKPLRWAIWTGLTVVTVSLFWLSFILIAQIKGWAIQGWASLIGAIILFSGVQLLLLGVLGQYIGQIYIGSKKRPQYILRNLNDE
jgi:dolichol-phosphate mannosyltransferase